MTKIYVHQGNGHYVGSAVVVIANSMKTAEKLIRKELDSMGLHDEPIDTSKIELSAIEAGITVLKISGDY